MFLVSENSSFELNFQTYHFAQESALFIPPGQFIGVDQANQTIPLDPDSPQHYRYLFSRVLTLGHVAVDNKMKIADTQQVLDHSNAKWKRLNPFNSTNEELDLLFDTNDWLDQNVEASFDIKSELIKFNEVQKLSKKKLQLTLFQWKNHKLVNQARQLLYESGGSVKETSYELGFKDTAYFCRFFRNNTTQSPGEFIHSIEEKPRAKQVLKNFNSLIHENIQLHHDVAFYADQLNLTSKTLGHVIKSASGVSPKEHIKNTLISRAEHLLQEGQSVSTLAFELGFQEISHFSNFFKTHTGHNPSNVAKSTIN